ncbi:hypothetical protein A5690_07065 [Mycobacterium intracellulare]|uniref:AAA domain-containing protein n=1 Tax=Mycobacterium intracellulare TaxID=1767 RepID=UPI0007E99EFD|nr:AAA domain-containing protein [Mycobacterium intracellulare]OBH37156.1 hypothetical protein A5690_07065 [Mycobacterium intracellulare]
MAAPEAPRPVSASEIGEFVRHDSCQRRFRLAAENRREARTLPFYERLFNTLDVVLTRAGHEREDIWTRFLDDSGVVNITGERPDDADSLYPDWQEFVDNAAPLVAGRAGYAREVRLNGVVGAFAVTGRADFLLIVWRGETPVVRIVECKASRRDRTYHRLQLALYRLLVRELLTQVPLIVAGIEITDVEAVVARIDETTNENQDILALDPLDLEMEEADVRRLLAADGTLETILATDLDQLPYELAAKCDSCVFDVHCFPESARQRRHELLGMRSSSATALRGAGVATIDDLADLDPGGEQARAVRADPAFADDLDALIATAATRRTTLPRTGQQEELPAAFPVTALPGNVPSQLPQHEFDGERLIRIYLNVDYDYTENRIGALAAHVTASRGTLHPAWELTDRTYADGTPVPHPAPQVVERLTRIDPASGDEVAIEQPVSARVIRFVKGSQWSGDYGPDTGAERELIQNFLMELINAIADIAGDAELGGAEDGRARVHFYVWSRSEITQLVEACTRASSRLLAALRELFGCRAGLEQLIYSCLQDEVTNRYALGWTSRGLVVASSLTWYGQRFHWTRRVSGQTVQLDRIFTQDLFDFRTTLAMQDATTWTTSGQGNFKHRFEIRSRFHDNLPAPYWHALWQSLPDPDAADLNAQTAAQIRRYQPAGEPNILPAYLEARTEALRWVEERIRFKNRELEKPRLEVADLRRFSLGVDDATAAAVDFLQLDHSVRMTDWVAAHMKPVRTRVTAGRSIPITDLQALGNDRLVARIDLNGYDITVDDFSERTSFAADSYVRISPHSGDPGHGQTPGQLLRNGKTCVVSEIRWEQGEIELEVRMTAQTRYVLQSFGVGGGVDLWDHATIDESPSDFVAGKVEARLLQGRGLHAATWFDPLQPAIPEQNALEAGLQERLAAELSSADLGGARQLSADQTVAVLDGLSARVQLLQGPPGTGKTQTTAVSVLSRIALRCQAGSIVLIAANTHTAVDTLLNRIHELEGPIGGALAAAGQPLPPMQYVRVNDNPTGPAPAWRIDVGTRSGVREFKTMSDAATLIVAGTTSGILGLARYLGSKTTWQNPNGFSAETLVVDEASMMVFPHFLALATCTSADSEILLAGDHRQLSPILANDWESEDRPPAVAYQPFVSAYNAVLQIVNGAPAEPRRVVRSALELSFRLPQQIIDLIARLYRRDEIELRGLDRPAPVAPEQPDNLDPVTSVWAGAGGLYLVLHDERESRTSNVFEAELVRDIVAAGHADSGEIAVITPHRAQRTLLSRELADHLGGAVDVVDTVERLQGGERPVVIVSGTASEPNAIGANAEFLLNLNRSNVAFSRSQDRLIVVCAKTLLDHIPAELDAYLDTLLWKSLRTICSEFVARAVINDQDVQVWTVPTVAPTGE